MKDQSNARAGGGGPRQAPGEPYAGPERRRHRVYLTRNTEYHLRDGRCVAVRSRRTGEFVRGHLALDHRLEGSLAFFPNGAISPNPGEPRPGESLCFSGTESDERELVTSPLEAVERPSRQVIEEYPVREERRPG
jgi:hypothetical protein